MHVRQGIRTTFVFFFSENVFYPNQTFLCSDFSQFSVRGFDNVLTLFFPMFPFDPPENIRKPKVF